MHGLGQWKSEHFTVQHSMYQIDRRKGSAGAIDFAPKTALNGYSQRAVISDTLEIKVAAMTEAKTSVMGPNAAHVARGL